jgi:hypothetical protein
VAARWRHGGGTSAARGGATIVIDGSDRREERMSQVGREDWLTMPIEDFAKHVWELGMDPRTAQGRLTAVTALVQTRAVLQATKDTKHLVWATWTLVAATAVLALVAAIVGG